MRNVAIWASAILAGLFSVSVGQAQSADQCISPEARRAVESCEAGQVNINWLGGGEARAAITVRGGFDPRSRPQRAAQGPALQLNQADVIDQNRQARALAIVRQEIQALKALVRTTRQNDPTRPQVIGRLAETFTEYQAALRAASGVLDEQIFCACPDTADAGCNDTRPNRDAAGNAIPASPEFCEQKQNEKTQMEAELAAAYNDSNVALARLVHDHPDYEALDRIMYTLAYGLQRTGREDQAQQVYLELATRFPQSRYVPHAFLAFGEYFFNANAMEDAQAAYERVLSLGTENNPVYGYAVFKLAWVFYNMNDYEHSLSRFEEALQFATDNPTSLLAGQIVAETLRNIVMPYALSRGPDRAMRDFMSYARNDRPKAMQMYEELALFYLDNGEWANAISSFRQLISAQPDSPKLCIWSGHVVDATMRSRPKQETVGAMNDLVALYERFSSNEAMPLEARESCQAKTASVVYILATQWHIEAVGGMQGADGSSGGGAGAGREVVGTRSQDTMRQAANLYEMLLRSFPNMDSFNYEAAGVNINASDLPKRYQIAYYYADLLYQSEDWQRCGPAFEMVTSIDPAGEYTNDAAGAAVRCYIRYYETTMTQGEGGVRNADANTNTPAAGTPAAGTPAAGGRNRRGAGGRNRPAAPPPEAETETENFTMRDFTPLEQGMIRAFGRFMCVATNESEDLVIVKYRRARVFYEANHFQEAAVLFRDIAINNKGHSPQDEYAANLYFNSLEILATRQQPARTACIDTLQTDSTPICNAYCSNDADRSRYNDVCRVCSELECNIKRRRAESYHNAHEWVKAAEAYLEIVELNTSRPAGQQCGAIPELLWNAGIDYETGYQIGMSIQVRTALIDNYPDTEQARKSIYMIGANYHAIAWYDQAADYYERFARQYPRENGADCSQELRDAGRCPVASSALMNATLFRLNLGDFEKAKADADLFAANYGRENAYETAKVQYAVGSFYEHREDWANVVLYYNKYLRDYGRTAPTHLLIQANSLIGRAYRLEGRADRVRQMREAYTAAIRLWESGRVAERLQALTIPDGEKARILKDTIDAAAEAYFYIAEVKFFEAEAIRAPEYHGGANDALITRYIQTEFMQWAQRRIAAVQAATVEYNKIRAVNATFTANGGSVEIRSEAWEIAAAARTGQMSRGILEVLRNLPIPEVVDQNPDLYEMFIGAIENQARPIETQAVGAFEFCLRTSTTARWFNEWSRTCEQELARLDAARYPPAAELRGAGGLDYAPAPWPPAIEELGAGASTPNTPAAEQGAAGAASSAAQPAAH